MKKIWLLKVLGIIKDNVIMKKHNALKSTMFFLGISLAMVLGIRPSNVMAYGAPYDGFVTDIDTGITSAWGGGAGYPPLYSTNGYQWSYSPSYGYGYPLSYYNSYDGFGYQQSYNPYGYQQPYQQSYNPYGSGYQQSYNPYSYQQSYNPYGSGYQQSYNPYSYQQSYNPYGSGYQQSYNPYSYQQSYNPYGYGYQQSYSYNPLSSSGEYWDPYRNTTMVYDEWLGFSHEKFIPYNGNPNPYPSPYGPSGPDIIYVGYPPPNLEYHNI